MSVQSGPWVRAQQNKWKQFWAREERVTDVQEWIFRDRWADH